MTESSPWKSTLEKELKACRNDDELRVHLRARLADDDQPSPSSMVHAPLHHSRQFRLVTLLPGTLEASLRCTLEAYELDVPPKYLALSYVWGDKDRTLPIECNQRIVPISVSLYSALLRIRPPYQELTIWIDALCINQGTDHDALRERAEQVRRMDQIFANADQVIVDLGGATKNQIGRFMQGYHDFHNIEWKGLQRNVEYELNDVQMLRDLDDPFWTTLYDFLDRPWFSRVWVVQEFVLARRVTMLMGNTEIDSWKLFLLISKAISFHGSNRPDIMTRTQKGTLNSILPNYRLDSLRFASSYAHMNLYRQQFHRSRQKQSLPTALDMSRNMEATDTRDHIYALAGLISNWNDLNIQVDYHQSEAATRWGVGRALIESDQAFYCLSRASGINVSAMTWMPPLRSDSKKLRRDQYGDENFMGLYHPVYKAAGDTKCAAKMSDTHTFLAITGLRIDVVKTLAPICPYAIQGWSFQKSQERARMAERSTKWWSAIHTWASRTFPEWSSSDVKHNLWRTMVLDKVDDVTKYPPIRTRASVPLLVKHFELFELLYADHASTDGDEVKEDLLSYGTEQLDLITSIWNDCHERKICSTDKGRIANVPHSTTHNNEIWVLLGIPFPMVLRSLGPVYAIVGPACVQGVMDGEALEQSGCKEETIYLA